LIIKLKIISSALVYAENQIEDLNEKTLVPNPLQRRRLTRSSKILLCLADKTGFENGRIILGSEFGECAATSEIIGAIVQKTNVSPTAFQNSVYNTPASYLSIQNGNKNEIVTLSDYQKSGDSVLKTAAIKSMLDNDEILTACVDALNSKETCALNKCGVQFLECGVALKVKYTDKQANIQLDKIPLDGFLEGHKSMVALHKAFEGGKNIFEVEI
jgi:hypothetical protein